jgi:hypothetical protein
MTPEQNATLAHAIINVMPTAQPTATPTPLVPVLYATDTAFQTTQTIPFNNPWVIGGLVVISILCLIIICCGIWLYETRKKKDEL